MAQPGPTQPIAAAPGTGVPAEVPDRASRRAGLAALVGVLVLVFCLALVAHPVRVQAHSMEPTYRPGDHLLVRTLGRRRDLPAVATSWSCQAPDGGELVKRVAAVAGDEVGIADGLLVVNGTVGSSPTSTRPPSTAPGSGRWWSRRATSSSSATTAPTRWTRDASAPCPVRRCGAGRHPAVAVTPKVSPRPFS